MIMTPARRPCPNRQPGKTEPVAPWYREGVLFGMTRGEIVLIAFIFALVYGAGHLPKLAASLGGKAKRHD